MGPYCIVLWWTSLSVCPLAYLENHTSELHPIFVHDRDSVFLWWRYGKLCRPISGVVDGVMYPLARIA